MKWSGLTIVTLCISSINVILIIIVLLVKGNSFDGIKMCFVSEILSDAKNYFLCAEQTVNQINQFKAGTNNLKIGTNNLNDSVTHSF